MGDTKGFQTVRDTSAASKFPTWCKALQIVGGGVVAFILTTCAVALTACSGVLPPDPLPVPSQRPSFGPYLCIRNIGLVPLGVYLEGAGRATVDINTVSCKRIVLGRDVYVGFEEGRSGVIYVTPVPFRAYDDECWFIEVGPNPKPSLAAIRRCREKVPT